MSEQDDMPILRYLHKGKQADEKGPVSDDKQIDLTSVKERYPWAFAPPVRDEEPMRPLVPSAMPEKQQAEAFSSQAGHRARQEGLYLHHLLEELSPIAQSDRQIAAMRLAEKAEARFGEINYKRRQELAEKMVRFTQDNRYKDLFTPQALIEFQISGIVGKRSVIGQIDRLVIYEDKLWLVDFKSGMPKTDNPPMSYVLQLALYADILGQIYQGKQIQADIIWLADFSSSSISEAQRQSALATADL